ncbi:MAG TPA: hypothetical protein VLV78_00570 [Thermoanaerobaculia bacterium]|nr:hypothetical protein [Thermoanaerobaculia bacterium]
MSRINGEKSRANLQKRKRTQQRMKDRAARAAAMGKTAAPAVKAAPKPSA